MCPPRTDKKQGRSRPDMESKWERPGDTNPLGLVGGRMDTSYRTRTDGNTPNLDEVHRRMLYDESGISPEVVAERGVRTVRSGRELPKVYSRKQKERAPGLLFTIHRPNGETSHIFRPDKPDPEKPGCKYLQAPKVRGGVGNVLDVHPRMRPLLDETSVPLVFVEGI